MCWAETLNHQYSVCKRKSRCPLWVISGHFGLVAVPALFDHYIGASDQTWRYSEAERFCGLEVHYKFEFC